MIGAAVYALCAITSGACSFLLAKRFTRTRIALLGWAALCFAFLFANNVLLFFDLIVLPNVDLSLARALTGVAGIAALLYGLLRDA